MIQRHRHPDGSNHDIDHGPGPVGKRPGHVLGDVPVSQGIGIVKLGMQPASPQRAAYKREWRKRQQP